MIQEPVPIDRLVEAWTDRRTESPPLSRKAVPTYGPSVDEPQETIQIRNPRTATASATSLAGAFCATYIDDGDTFIVGGNVSGGNGGSKEMDDYNVTGPTSGVLYVKVNVTAETADGVLLPGLEVNPASTSYTTTGGSNDSLTAASPTGDFYVEIGRWAPDGTYIPTRCGHIFAGGCPGNYQVA